MKLMRVNQVRMLVITGDDGVFKGIVTAMDLIGRKPMVYARDAGIPCSYVTVKNVMIDKEKLPAMTLAELHKVTLGDVIHTLNALHEQHILVVNETVTPMSVVGVLSASDFKRALGVSIDTGFFPILSQTWNGLFTSIGKLYKRA